MGALAKTGCFPFDQNREGLVLGEGGAMLMLETLTSAQKRQAKIYGEMLGWSFTCDADHVSAPQKTHRAAVRAIAQCLQRSGLRPEEIDHIHPHGTSTRLNDQAEAEMITALFPQRPWVSGSKGATGHSLGASGIISAAFTLMLLESQTLFPNVGLKNAAFDLNFVRQAQAQLIQTALCLCFGFGGQNGAIAFQKIRPEWNPE
jgi:3-oxoacyl-[acyl-carrier-protein] synthase II